MNKPFYYTHHVQVAVVYEVFRKVKELYKDFKMVEIKRFIRKIKLQALFEFKRGILQLYLQKYTKLFVLI